MARLFNFSPSGHSADLRSYATNVLVSISGYVFGSGLTFIFGIVAARALGPEGNGALSLFLVVLSTVPVVISAGLGQAAVFAINRQKASAKTVASELWTAAWLWGGIAAVGILAVGVAWNLRSSEHFSPLMIGAAVLLTPLLLAKHYAEYLYVSLQRFGWHTAVITSELLLRLGLFAVLIRWPGGINGAVLAIVVAVCGSVAIGWLNLVVSFGTPRIVMRLPTLRPLLSYGWMNHLSVLVAHLNLRVDQFLIAAALPVRDLGIYVTAVTLAELPIKIATALSKVLFARVASCEANEATQVTSATLRIVMTLAVGIAVTVWLSRESLVVAVYGKGYSEAGQALAWLLPGAVLFNYVQLLNSDLAGRGYPGSSVLAGAAGLTVGVSANLLLTPWLGINGAAISTSLGYAVNALVVVIRYCGLTKESPTRLMLVTWSDVCVIINGFRIYIKKLHG